MNTLSTVLANAIALFIVSNIITSLHIEGGVLTYAIIGVILSILNLIIKPILKVLTFPLVFITGGLFLVVINALVLYLCEYILKVIDVTGVSMSVDGTLTYFWAAAILGLANWLIHWFLKED